jgi:hypothetical protein
MLIIIQHGLGIKIVLAVVETKRPLQMHRRVHLSHININTRRLCQEAPGVGEHIRDTKDHGATALLMWCGTSITTPILEGT